LLAAPVFIGGDKWRLLNTHTINVLKGAKWGNFTKVLLVKFISRKKLKIVETKRKMIFTGKN
jgi:hypothetical protein